MSNIFEKNKTFIAIIISGLLISSAIRSLDKPEYISTDLEIPLTDFTKGGTNNSYLQTNLSTNEEIKNSGIQQIPENKGENKPAESTADDTPNISESKLYKVIKVVDGDTIKVDMDGKTETIRLIGIDSPEVNDARESVKCFGEEASNKAREILYGKNVKLEADNTQGERDKYGRLLRYVFLEDGTNINKMMIDEGYAYEYTYKFPYKYQSEFKEAEIEAKNAKKGLWSDNACNINLSSTSKISIPPITTNSENCFCESNKYNCSDFKTRKEAQNLFDCCMKKVGEDVHYLDKDKDWLVCESLP